MLLCVTSPSVGAGNASALQTNTTLQEIDLSHNHISPESADALNRLYPDNDTLQCLGLSCSGLELTGATAVLAAGLGSSHCSLTKLDLSINKMGKEGGMAIASSLASNGEHVTDTSMHAIQKIPYLFAGLLAALTVLHALHMFVSQAAYSILTSVRTCWEGGLMKDLVGKWSMQYCNNWDLP